MQAGKLERVARGRYGAPGPMHQAGAFFVTRAKSGMQARRVCSAAVDRASGVIRDQRIMFNGFYPPENYPEHLRRVRFKDAESGQTLAFLTNNTSLPALRMAALHRSRWQVAMSITLTPCGRLSILPNAPSDVMLETLLVTPARRAPRGATKPT